MEWIDLALHSDEGVKEYLENLLDKDPGEADRIRKSLLGVLDLSENQAQLLMLRLMIEKARPFALPLSVWKKQPSQSGTVSGKISEHLESLNIEPNKERLNSLQKLHRSFHQGRIGLHIDEEKLRKQNYSCAQCGYRFTDTDLQHCGIQSTHSVSPKRVDTFKPHWNTKNDTESKRIASLKRKPSIDHIWPVSLYGGNDSANLSIICSSCNSGKSNYLTAIQTKHGVGLPKKENILTNIVDDELFFSCINLHKKCNNCKKGPRDAELTVRKKNSDKPLVLENLAVYCYYCVPFLNLKTI